MPDSFLKGYTNPFGDPYLEATGKTIFHDNPDDWNIGETRQFDKAIKSLESQSKSLEKQAIENEARAKEKLTLRLGFQAGFREMIHTHKIDMTVDEFNEQLFKDIESLKQGVKMNELSPRVEGIKENFK